MHVNVAWQIIHKHYSCRVRPENAVKRVKSRESQENDGYMPERPEYASETLQPSRVHNSDEAELLYS